MSDVTDLIGAYRAGELTLDELARRFQERTWPAPRQSARTAEELYARELEDPDPPADGSFDEVVNAYHAGRLTAEEYRVLSRAVAEASGGL